MSPTELRSVLQTSAQLLSPKINALQDRWYTSMGPIVPDFPIVHPESQVSLNKIASRAGLGGGSQPQGQGAPVQIQSAADYAALRPTTRYVDPNGTARIKQ